MILKIIPPSQIAIKIKTPSTTLYMYFPNFCLMNYWLILLDLARYLHSGLLDRVGCTA